MREKETEPKPGAPYMSPLVKQDLARLDKDGESRRSAMNSLKQFVENLDPGSMPRFLAQVGSSLNPDYFLVSCDEDSNIVLYMQMRTEKDPAESFSAAAIGSLRSEMSDTELLDEGILFIMCSVEHS